MSLYPSEKNEYLEGAPLIPVQNPYKQAQSESNYANTDNQQASDSCMTSLFKCMQWFQGGIYTCCCLPFACCGCGPTIQVREGNRAVVLHYGKYERTVMPGTYHYNIGTEKYIPVSIQDETMAIPRQTVMTNDNVSVYLDAVIFYRVVDVTKAIFNVNDSKLAMKNLAECTIQQLISEHTLEEVFSKRHLINQRVTQLIENQTTQWGVHVIGLEIRDIQIPEALQRVMAIVAEASREGQAKCVTAEAEKKAAVTYAEAGEIMSSNPLALQLRYFQTLTEIAAEKNSTILVPSEITNMFRGVGSWSQSDAFPGTLTPQQRELLKGKASV